MKEEKMKNGMKNEKKEFYKKVICDIVREVLGGENEVLLILFGSFARGDAVRTSDIDIAIYSPRLTTKKLFEIEKKLEEEILRHVEVIDLSEVENPEFLEEILKGEIWIENEEFLRGLKKRLEDLRKR